MTDKYVDYARVKSLTFQDIKFSACENTISKIKAKKSKEPVLTQGGVTRVQAGVARIVELQEEGYSYIRP